VGHRGSALLAVLWLSAALSAIAFAMSVTVRGETARTATSMDELRSYYLASAGVQKAIVELLWTATQGAGLIPAGTPSVDYDFPSGTAHVEIIPEAAKLNVNKASFDQLQTLLTALGVDGGRATTIAAGMVDWRSPSGAGSPFDSYYLSLTPSFQAPHASFQEIEEILSVRGVTPDIFYGTWVAAGNGDAGENPLVRRPGLNDCLTVYGVLGSGDVNSALAARGRERRCHGGRWRAARRRTGHRRQHHDRRKRHRHVPFHRAPAPSRREVLRYAAHRRRASEVRALRIGRESVLRPAVV
jgi:general secretion pathway protein K